MLWLTSFSPMPEPAGTRCKTKSVTSHVSDLQKQKSYWTNRSSSWIKKARSAKARQDIFTSRLIEEAGITPAMDVLDVASGTGDPAITIAEKLTSGNVIAYDMTTEMLSVAAARATKLILTNMHIITGDMTALPFPDHSFDAVTSRNGLMFSDKKLRCASEALRVLKPGRKAGWLVWGAIESNPTFLAINAGLESFFGEKFRPRMIRHNLGKPGLLKDIIQRAGFEKAEEIGLKQERVITQEDDFFRRAIQRAIPQRVGALSETEWSALLKIAENACTDYLEGENFKIPTLMRLGIGTTPA